MLASGLSGEATTRGDSGTSHAEELVELLSRVTRLYMALLQLENFAVLNYCGLGKILVSGGVPVFRVRVALRRSKLHR